MKIVITGANSFLGRRLTKRAAEAGWETVAVMRHGRNEGIDVPGCHTVFLDMEEYSSLGAAAGGGDCLVNLAWNGTRGSARMDRDLQERNYICSLAAVNSMLAAGCGTVVTAGSQAEYGPNNDVISEETLCRPNTEYGVAKLRFFNSVRELCEKEGASYKEPRFFSLYGPGDYPQTLIMSTLGKMLDNAPCAFTESVQMWDFLYVDDAVDALFQLIARGRSADGIYNFGSGDTRELRDYIMEMAEITGTSSELRFGEIPYPATGMVSLTPDVTKLKKELRWEPQVSFARGIRAIIDSFSGK